MMGVPPAAVVVDCLSLIATVPPEASFESPERSFSGLSYKGSRCRLTNKEIEVLNISADLE